MMDANDSNQDLGASFLTEGQFLVQSDDGNYLFFINAFLKLSLYNKSLFMWHLLIV